MLSNCFSSKKKKLPLVIGIICASGLCPHCHSLTSSSPCLCPMMFLLLQLLDSVSMCWGASRGLERSCYCSTTQRKVHTSGKKQPSSAKKNPGFISSTESSLLCVLLSRKCLRYSSPALDLHLQAVHWFINGSFEFFLSLLDVWSELLPTLTRASVDLPTLYFLGATDRLLVIGGNNSENVVTSFCAESQKWGPVNNQQTHTHIGRALDYLDA